MINRILTLSLLLINIYSGANAGNWTSYTNSDAVRQIGILGNRVWAATSGGAMFYDNSNGNLGKLTNIDGLGTIDLRCVEIDTSGRAWFGGDGYLSRLDGLNAVRNFAIRDSAGIIGVAVLINDLKIDGDRLWMASDLGVSKFLLYSNGGEIRDTARRLGNLPSEEDAVCVEIIAGMLWVGTARGLAFIDKDNSNIQYFGNWRSFSVNDNGLTNDDIKTIASYYDTVFVGTDSGTFKFQVSPDTLWIPAGLGGLVVNKLYSSPSGFLAATNAGLYSYDGVAWVAFPGAGLPLGLAADLAYDQTGSLWAGTPSSGLAKFDIDQWTLYSTQGPASNIIEDLAFDSSGGIWMDHNSRGLSRVADGQWQIFNASNSDPDGPGPLLGLADNDAVGITVAPDGKVWVGSYGGGLYQYDWASWLHWNSNNSPMYGVPNAPYYWAVTSVEADHFGNIWMSAFGSDSLLFMGEFNPRIPDYPDSAWLLWKAPEIGVFTNFVQCIRSQNNFIWVGRGDGLDRLDTRGTPFDKTDDAWEVSLGRTSINDMVVDPSGTLWLAAATGLYAVVDTPVSIDLPPEISGSVKGVSTDGVGNIWVGTVAGLGVLKPDRVRLEFSRWQSLYTSANSQLVNSKVNCVRVHIPTGRVFAGTDGGLSVFESGILPPSPDLADMDAFPNPVILSSGVQLVEFKKVPSSGTLSVYTASGDMVIRFDLAQTNTWDLRNSKGELVAGGIYFFHVKSGDASGSGKIAIIR